MEQIAQSVGILSITVIAMGILYSFGSFPATEKTIKFIISVYIVLMAIRIAGKENINIDFNGRFAAADIGEHQGIFNEMLIDQTETELVDIIEMRLKEKNISYKSVKVHILEQNDILSAESITINCDDKYELQVKECIKDILSDDTQVYIGENIP